MPAQPDYTVELVGPDGEPDMSVAVIGQQLIDLSGGSPGDVLTLQPDGTVAPEPGGAPAAHAATHEDGGTDPIIGPLDLGANSMAAGTVGLTGGPTLGKNSATTAYLQGSGADQLTVLRVMPKGAAGGVTAAIELFGTDFNADGTNFERLNLRANAGAAFTLSTDQGGTGTRRGLNIDTGTLQVPSKFAVGGAPTGDMVLLTGTHPDGGGHIAGIDSRFTIPATANASVRVNQTTVTTAAAAFTLTNLYNYYVEALTIGAGSAVTNAYGFKTENLGQVGVTNAFGLDVAAVSGAATLNVAARLSGGATANLWLDSDTASIAGGIAFGTARDTTLFRSAAGVLGTVGSIAIGATPATTGTLRLPNGFTASFRNNANTADILVMNLGAGNIAQFWGGADGLALVTGSNGPIYFTPNESTVVSINTDTFTLVDGFDVQVGTVIGTKIGTATTQKLGFFDATPIVQPANTTDLRAAIVNLGLLASGGATPLNLNGGSLTAATGAGGGTGGFFVGDIGAGAASYYGIAHSSMATSTNYALIQNSIGQTAINAAAGRTVTLGINNSVRLTLANTLLTFADSVNIAFNGTTGTKIGTATTDKLAFWNATPIVQPTTAVAEAVFVENAGGTVVNDDSTFDGYTVRQVVKALRNEGLLA